MSAATAALTEESRTTAELERTPPARDLLMQAPAAIAVFRGADHIFSFANPRYCALVQRTSDQLIGRRLRDVFPELEHSSVWELFDRVVATGERFHAPEYEAAIDRGRGLETGWYSFNLEPLRRGDGTVEGLMSLAVEITDQVIAKRELHESRHRFAQILDSVQDLVFTKSPDLTLTYANAACCRHYGVTAEQLRGVRAVPFNDEVVESYLRDDRKVFETGTALEIVEEPHVRHDGETRLFHTIKTPILDTAGRVVELVGVARDVTEVKRAEREAMAERSKLELALDAGRMGVWDWSVDAGEVRWSPALERMHGIPIGSFAGTFDAFARDIHAEDRERVLRTLKHSAEEKREHSFVYRIVRPDSEVRFLETFGRVSADDVPARVIGVCRDVTDRVRSEEAELRLRSAEVARNEAEAARGRMQAVFESISDPFSVLDRQLRVTFVNSAAASALGMTPDVLIGKSLHDIVPNAEELAFVKAYRRVLETGKVEVLEDYYEPLDKWFEVTIYPLGEGLSVYSRDVSARKRSEALQSRLALHASLRADVTDALATHADVRQMLQRCAESIVERLNVSFARVWTLDDEGTTLLLQASAGKYTHIDGPHRAVPVGKFKIGLIAAEKRAHLTNDVQHDSRVGNPEWARAEGMVAFAGYPLLVDDRVVGVMALFSTSKLSEDTLHALASVGDAIAQGIVRRRAELELEARASDLARSNADLEQFAYVASHDLQEPLRMIASYNQLLARRYKGKLDKDADDFIGYTVEGVTRMQRLINDLLAYSRVGRRGKDFVKVDMAQVSTAARSNLERAIADENAEVTFDELPTVTGDDGQLTQVLQNLIANAIKFHGDAPPRVHVGCKRVADEWVISVKDNGIGVDPQYFDRIFVIFQRLHPRESYPGTGIGLAICKKIVERHGGRIWIESDRGSGSTVSFTIPATPRPWRS